MEKVRHCFKKNFCRNVLLSLLCILSSCSSAKEVSTVEENPIKQLTISVDGGLITKDFRDFADNFAQMHSIEIEIKNRPSGSAGENEVITELFTENASDILLFSSGGLFKSLDPLTYFYDLSSEYYTNRYIDSYYKAVSVDNNVFGLPIGNADAVGFLYRKDIYSDYGLSIPNSLNGLEKNLDIIKAAEITPILTPFKDQWLTQYYWYIAELIQNKEDMEAYTEILRTIDLWKEKKYFNTDMLTMSLTKGLTDFSNKNSAHLLSQYSFKNYLTSNHLVLEENIGFFPFPNKRNEYIYMLPSSLYINRNTEEIDLCLTFFEEYFRLMVENNPTSAEQPGILTNSEIKPDKIIYEQQSDYKVDILPDLLVDFFTDNISVEELIDQYKQRRQDLQMIY